MTKKKMDGADATELHDLGYSIADIEEFVRDSVVQGKCQECGETMSVEPDAYGYDCSSCGAKGTVESPFITLGLI